MGKGSSSEPAGSALHTVGSRVWVWKDDWMRGEVVSMSGPRLRVRLEGGDEHECTAAEIPLQNSSAAGVEVSKQLHCGGVGRCQAAQLRCRRPQPQSVGVWQQRQCAGGACLLAGLLCFATSEALIGDLCFVLLPWAIATP